MIELSWMFQDGMILQRDKVVLVWGFADAGTVVEVDMQGSVYKAEVSDDGTWCVKAGPLTTSASETIEVRCGEETLTVSDVAVGDIYLAGGQSNMEFLMRYEKHFEDEKAKLEAEPDPLIRFFDVPEIAYDGQDRDFDYSKVGLWRKATAADLDYFTAPGYYFARQLRRDLDIPVGIIGLNWGGTKSSAWMSEDHAREICPEQVNDFETKLGEMSYEEFIAGTSDNPGNSRGYSEWSPFDEFILPRTPGPEELGAFFKKMMDSGLDITQFLTLPNISAYPGTLYEHMVKRAAPFTVKGSLWYQGESDDEIEGSAGHYQESLTAVVSDWRELWGEELPFLIVQLPGFRKWLECVNLNYNLIRDAQKAFCDNDSNAYLCSISDSGEEFDIHPKNKAVVGDRLAKLALKHLYGKNIEADAPVLRSAEAVDGKIRLAFDNAGDGLHVSGDTINSLVVTAGGQATDYSFEINGNEIILDLHTDCVGEVKIEFAREQWYTVNLYNSGGIPAVPFTAGI